MEKSNRGIIKSLNFNAEENLNLTQMEERLEFSIAAFEIMPLCSPVCDAICDAICDSICGSGVCDSIW